MPRGVCLLGPQVVPGMTAAATCLEPSGGHYPGRPYDINLAGEAREKGLGFIGETIGIPSRQTFYQHLIDAASGPPILEGIDEVVLLGPTPSLRSGSAAATDARLSWRPREGREGGNTNLPRTQLVPGEDCLQGDATPNHTSLRIDYASGPPRWVQGMIAQQAD